MATGDIKVVQENSGGTYDEIVLKDSGVNVGTLMTNPMTASGDIIYGGTSGAPTRLTKGTDGNVLTLASGVPAWAASTGGSGAVEAKNTGYTIQTTDSTKTFTCNSSSAQSFNLPSVSSSDVGFECTVVKLGAGQVTIDAADSDLIEDSGAGDTIYCNDETIATITLKLVTETQWIIKFASGTWTTTD